MDAPESKSVQPKGFLGPRQSVAAWLATGLGVSQGVPAPGTVGAIWGVPLWLALAQIPSYPAQLAVIAGLILVGGPLCTRAARDLHRHGLTADTKDPQAITWDEFTTVPLVYAFAPGACTCVSWLLAGFALHRLFDITKPWPCRRLERLPDGWGVMADDVAAACYAGLCYTLLWRWWSGSW
ncbi:Phosphatidylglycerophosphatase A [Planctomycetes bacterium MalM25]|nr:Phosphatidylglycerophosphatase A [Planctomycetes bacterium MalM25]